VVVDSPTPSLPGVVDEKKQGFCAAAVLLERITKSSFAKPTPGSARKNQLVTGSPLAVGPSRFYSLPEAGPGFTPGTAEASVCNPAPSRALVAVSFGTVGAGGNQLGRLQLASDKNRGQFQGGWSQNG